MFSGFKVLLSVLGFCDETDINIESRVGEDVSL